ncbi:mandelate racemase/muconate lactonizing enzyme family protein [Actinomadura macrotermitis]|uniref:Muconate cycloisomerase 1 n=1 Tax=Actinomadura macrotermitis TaxID=2585200 RepID=A0A7K0BV06_9ACTN|nr:enolase C-terminal domain-like protein [Actinomadura macrotermitis]MQY05040.1 Muconate cycloisomerase 1 [Actinomadura macrotermitis]
MTGRIAEVRAVVRSLRMREHQVMGAGDLAGHTDNVFVRVRDEDGVCGYGEAATWALFAAETPSGIRDLVEELFAPLLIGRSALDLNACTGAIESAILANPAAKSSVEMALVDLAARRLGVPAMTLFGGPVRDSLGLSYSVSAQDRAAEADLVAARYAEGYRIFKLKTGVRPWREDLARLEALCGFADDISVRLDFNGTGTVPEIGMFLRAAAGLPLEFVEQPFAPGDTQALRWLRQAVPVAFCADESFRGTADLQRIVADGTFEVVSLKVGKLGGLRATAAAARTAATFGIRGYAGAFSETRLATSAALQLMVTLDPIVDGSDYYFSLVVLDEPVPDGGYTVKDGRLVPWTEPGFGVELAEEWFV